MDDPLARCYKEMEEQFEREALHFAAGEGGLDQIHRLLDRGVPVSAFDDLGKTPLHYAAEKGHLSVIRILIEAGADVNARDESCA